MTETGCEIVLIGPVRTGKSTLAMLIVYTKDKAPEETRDEILGQVTL